MSEKKIKHYNGAHLKGIVRTIEKKTTKDHNKPYLELKVDCRNAKDGNVNAYCRMWGKKNVEEFEQKFKEGDSVHLQGQLVQYEGQQEDKTGNSFNVYKAEPWSADLDERYPYNRATIILTGKVTSIEELEDEYKIGLHVATTSSSGYSNEFMLKIFCPADVDKIKAVLPEYIVEFKCKLKKEEDEYGESIRRLRPVVGKIIIKVADVPF